MATRIIATTALIFSLSISAPANADAGELEECSAIINALIQTVVAVQEFSPLYEGYSREDLIKRQEEIHQCKFKEEALGLEALGYGGGN